VKFDRMQAEVAGKTIEVPVYGDRERTLDLVRRVTARFKAIESESDRIDTQAFALRTALSFAADLANAEAEHQAEQEDVFRRLEELGKRVDALVREYRIES